MSDQLRDKLQQYEVSPPPGVWTSIARELKDANSLLPLSSKLYHHEVTPPPMAWNTIKEAISADTPASDLAPVKSIRKPLYKVTVAAAVVGVVLLGSLYFFNNNPLKKNTFSQTNSSDNTGIKPESDDEPGNPPAVEPQTAPSPQLMATAYPIQKTRRPARRDNMKTLRNATIKDGNSFGADLAIMIAAKPIRNHKGDIIQDINLMRPSGKKYINVTGPNGQQTRISSKFRDVLLYMNDNNVETYEGYFDKSFIESPVWKTRFEAWRKKIIETSFIPSSTNYLDILEFKDLILNQKKDQ